MARYTIAAKRSHANTMDEDGFVANWLPRLPWTILMEIFSHVTPNLIYEGLLPVPQLRPTIISQFYARELHFILSPSPRPHACTNDPLKSALIDVVSFGEIEEFLTENEDIVPQKVKVITSSDFRSMEILLTQFRQYFLSVPTLELDIGKYTPEDHELEFLLGFPNLSKLQVSEIKEQSQKVLSESLERNTCLKELVFLGHRISDWSKIGLPAGLEQLDISWFPSTDVTTIRVPEKLENLYWNGVGLTSGLLSHLTFTRNLRTLMLTYNQLDTVNVSQLPRTLETIDFSCNRISKFTFDAGQASWPPKLKSILLHENWIDDCTMKQLSQIAWPCDLRDLRLDRNHFTSLEHFRSLPSSIKYLNLSETKLRTFVVSHNDDSHPYFSFPESLERLDMMNCRQIQLDTSGAVKLELRVQFPQTLERLNLSGCRLKNLSCFVFPRSLRSLSLTENYITDLDGYNLTIDSDEVVSWKHLTNLSELELFFNHISTLEHWVPPPQLRRLNLGENKLEVLTARNTPLFCSAYKETTRSIQHLSLESNAIKTIENDVSLPSNLSSLNLSSNCLSEFVFSETIASHRRLSDLDLGHNVIERLQVQKKGTKSSLKKLNLSHNACADFKMSVPEFYGVFEDLGLTVLKRKHKIESEHHFR